ncbi:DUF2997 domain-containing protein [Metabacillus bambusae]|uniref:DUF2997 domain-containing protein n=1 Tax=Metabacillus bambusae TaxID=2795218 RepID=A0ABS3NAW8_9BACI|nr:DUF2997 domain-containing protein [Metabacillus bambusae]MBO1515415.1 DUF2997 domain-containing protein [Metabacillus bambusae]
MEKRVRIEIGIDGKIKAETLGIKGKKCLEFIQILEQMLDAETIDSEYTSEYLETNVNISETVIQKLKEER